MSLQPTLLQDSFSVPTASLDPTSRTFYNSSSVNDAISATDGVVVRSNTISGDRAHARGMVVARVVKGNIPVQNGVVHLIDKPLMIVAKTIFEYIMVSFVLSSVP